MDRPKLASIHHIVAYLIFSLTAARNWIALAARSLHFGLTFRKDSGLVVGRILFVVKRDPLGTRWENGKEDDQCY